MAKSRKTGQYIMWAIVALMVVAMGGFGFNSAMQGTRSNAAFKVGDTEVDINEYHASLRQAIADFSAQQGAALSMEEARLLGIPNQIRQQLINEAVLREMARRSGIIVPDQAVLAEITKIEAFQNTDGAFNRASFDRFLLNQQISEDAFIENIRKNLEAQMVVNALSIQSSKLENAAHSIAEDFGEKRVVSYMTIGNEALGEIAPVDETSIRARFDENPEGYLGEAERHFSMAYLLPDPNAVGDEELAALYESEKAKFSKAETLDYKQLGFATEAEALAAIGAGNLDEIAAARGLESADYTYQGQTTENLPEELIAEIKSQGAKSQSAGIYGPYQGPLGFIVYEVSAFHAALEPSLEEIKGELSKLAASDKLNRILSDEYDALLDQIASGVTPKELAETSALQYGELVTGKDVIAGMSEDPAFIAEALAAQIGEGRELVKLANGGVVFLRLEEEREAQPLAFEAVKDDIRAELEAEAKESASQDLIARLKAEIKAGTRFEDVAQNHGLHLVNSKALTEQEAPRELPLALAFDMFSQNANEAFDIADQDQSYLAIIKTITPFDADKDAELLANINAQLNETITNGIIVNALTALANEYGTTMNSALIEQAEAQIN